MLDWGLHGQGGRAWGFGSKTRPNHIDYRCTWHLAVGRPFTTKSSARARGHVAVDSSAKVLDINRTAAHLAHTCTHIGTHAQQVARARVRAVRPVCIGLARAMIILTHSLVSRESHLQSHFVQINPASHLLSRLVCFPHVLTLCGKCAWKFRLSNLLSARIDLPTYQLAGQATGLH